MISDARMQGIVQRQDLGFRRILTTNAIGKESVLTVSSLSHALLLKLY